VEASSRRSSTRLPMPPGERLDRPPDRATSRSVGPAEACKASSFAGDAVLVAHNASTWPSSTARPSG
jgi:hypothetical protein